MELYIRIKDGQPYEHPILGNNLRDALGVDTDNLPPEFARFERVPQPSPDPGNRIASATCTYQWVGDVVKDVWEIVQVPEDQSDV